MKKIEDYLHLYLGCEVLLATGETARLIMVGLLGNETQRAGTLAGGSSVSKPWKVENKPVLRPLSSMTEEERKESGIKISSDLDSKVVETNYPWESIRYLLSKSFDLFGLIDAGLAINATTLKHAQ